MTEPTSPKRTPPPLSGNRSPSPASIAMIVFILLAMMRILVFTPEAGILPTLQQTATVKYVIDGDTVDLEDGRRVRLLGIDAPEAGYGSTVAEFWSEESTDWLRNRIEGQVVRLQIDQREKDRYGRTLAWLFDEHGQLINREILAEGCARLLPDFGLPVDLEPTLREAESEARIQRKGVWNSTGKARSPSDVRTKQTR